MNLAMLKVIQTCAADPMSLNGRDEEVPVALVRSRQPEQDLLYLSLVEGQVGLLEVGMRASDGLVVSVTAVNVQRANVADVGGPYRSPGSSERLVSSAGGSAPRVDVSHWRPLSEFEDRFTTENADVRYICYRDAISIKWARETATEHLEDGQVTWMVGRDRCLLGLVIRTVSANEVAMFKASLV